MAELGRMFLLNWEVEVFGRSLILLYTHDTPIVLVQFFCKCGHETNKNCLLPVLGKGEAW